MINKAGGQNFQLKMQQAVLKDARTIDSKEASQAAQTGASSTVGTKSKELKSKGPKEGSILSEAAQKALDAAEAKVARDQDKTHDVRQESIKDVADNALQGTKRRTQGDDEEDKKVGHGELKETKENKRVFALDDESAEPYEVSETQGKKMDKLDERTPESILDGMPDGAKAAAKATLDTQMQTRGTDKVSELKDDPKITAVAEKMDLDPAESLRESAVPAPIRDAKVEPPMLQNDPHSEEMVKEAARRQLENGEGQEAMIAS